MRTEATSAPAFTVRAAVGGALVGLPLMVGNLYMGLKTGWWDSGSITSAILGYALLSAWRDGGRAGPHETAAAMSLAAALGAAPAAAGLLGALPALALLGRPVAPWAAAGWGVALGALGVLLALWLRRRLLEEEGLPFPTGVATAEVIAALHADGQGGRGRVLLGTAGLAAAVAWLRDGWPAVIPAALAWPGRALGLPGAALGLGLALSPMMVGAGLLVGLQNGLSVLLGAGLGWGLLAPDLVARGAVAGADYAALAGWLVWPGVALMLGSAAVALLGQGRALLSGVSDLFAAQRGRAAAGGLALAAAVALALLVGWAGLGLPVILCAAGLVLAVPLCAASARAAGRTDVSPAGDVGQLAQVAVGALVPGGAGASTAAGSIVAGAAAQAGVSLWSLRAGQRLGASARAQGWAMLLGASLGALVSAPVYAVLVSAAGVGTATFPAPFALRWKAVAEVMAGGASALPPGAFPAAALALLAGAALELLGRTRAGRFLPAPGAVAIGFVAPASYAAAIALGAVLAAAWRRVRPAAAEGALPLVGAGAIAGESVAGFLAALLTSLR
ncbi:MAG TPA: OPT/YSL family transporter [Anaeromyxobacteraceae bacterium]|nr:OPT/YSL family transporter [Anaeromyxobacteraceae bacterium]